MLSRWPIRYKLLLCATILCLIVGALVYGGMRGVYGYRLLARTISQRASELPKAAELTRSVHELRFTVASRVKQLDSRQGSSLDPVDVREEFRLNYLAVKQALQDYAKQLKRVLPVDPSFGDSRQEQEKVQQIEDSLDRIGRLHRDEDWVLHEVQVATLEFELNQLNALAGSLPSFLHQRMYTVHAEVRTKYRTWIVLTWTTSISAVLMLVLLVRIFYRWVLQPLRVLIAASRRVAAGEYDHRVQLNSRDEMAELAGAMNEMTEQFQRKVKLRTKEVVRSEQLASVGFLAAGVAHEINNPLASIAWCAESLESRLEEEIAPAMAAADRDLQDELVVLRDYMKKIQDEAFRCKGITERLLDFSRMGEVERTPTNLTELTQGVLKMVQHLGIYRGKTIKFSGEPALQACVNAQEMKQVVMNLLTNALDSLESNGCVEIEVNQLPNDESAELIVRDDGCGMTPDVIEQLFEPFFTRRRDGQGTGLGLSITYQIIADHGGVIQATSDGPGKGSTFRVVLPLNANAEPRQKHYEQVEKVA